MSIYQIFTPPKAHLELIMDRGGLGDSLARLPALKSMLERHSHVSVAAYVRERDLKIMEYLFKHSRLSYRLISEAGYRSTYPRIEFSIDRLSSLGLHLTDHAFLTLMDRLPDSDKDKAYWVAPEVMKGLGFFERRKLKELIPKEPFVVLTTDHTAPARQWPDAFINEIGLKLSSSGLRPLLLGQADGFQSVSAALHKDLFIDLRGKTTLIEALSVIQSSQAVLGIDNGLIHLACYTNRPVVAGYTSVRAKLRVPVREDGKIIAIEANTPTYGYQGDMFAVNHDMRYDPTDTYMANLDMGPDRFLEALKQLNVLK